MTPKKNEGTKEGTTVQKILNATQDIDAWNRIKTNVADATITKFPERKDGVSKVAINLNPAHSKTGVFISSVEQLEKYRQAFNSEKVEELAKAVSEINGERTKVEEQAVISL